MWESGLPSANQWVAGRRPFEPATFESALNRLGASRSKSKIEPINRRLESHVKALLYACCAVMIATVPGMASAESLRCNGQSVSEGDTRLALRYKCGEPLMADTYCAPVYYAPTYQPVPEPFASIVVPCQLVEEWLYDRGPGNLLAVVRIRSGVVQSIQYGRSLSPR